MSPYAAFHLGLHCLSKNLLNWYPKGKGLNKTIFSYHGSYEQHQEMALLISYDSNHMCLNFRPYIISIVSKPKAHNDIVSFRFEGYIGDIRTKLQAPALKPASSANRVKALDAEAPLSFG